MNIKSLRKDYKNLTLLERLALADNALSRDDENELKAIVAASPRENFNQVDYFDLMQEITKFRLCNIIVRLNYIMLFEFFSMQSELDFLNNKSSSERDERLWNDARMSAFLYVRATDSWKIVNDELGLRPDFDAEISQFLFSLDFLKDKEEVMREIAFTEDEIREEIKNYTRIEKIQTLEDEIKAIREALDLPKGWGCQEFCVF